MIVLIISSFGFAVLGYKIHENLMNPLTIFNSVWFSVIFLYSLGLSQYPDSLSERGIMAIGIMLICFNSSYFTCLFVISRKLTLKRNRNIKELRVTKRTIRRAFCFWCVIIVIEIIYSGGLPLIWLLTGSSKTYAQFGISSIHGCINGLAWVIIMSCVIYLLDVNKKDKTIIKILCIVVGTYVLLVARQALVTCFIEVLVILVIKNKIGKKNIIISLVISIIIFGVLGNFRTSAEHFTTVANMSIELPDFLLGFAWVYMYMITPLGNIDAIVNSNIAFQHGIVSLQSLLPTVVVNIFIPNGSYSVSQFYVSEAFNVSSFLKEFYIDFGMYGIMMISTFTGALGVNLWNKIVTQKDGEIAVMNYAIYINIISLSFFTNMFLSLPIIIQFFYITILYKWRIKFK